MNRFHSSTVNSRTRLSILIVVLALFASGCQQFDRWRGPGFPDDESTTFRKPTEKPPKSERFFFDERANEIEKHLGL